MVNIWGSYGQEFSVLFFLTHSVYRFITDQIPNSVLISALYSTQMQCTAVHNVYLYFHDFKCIFLILQFGCIQLRYCVSKFCFMLTSLDDKSF